MPLDGFAQARREHDLIQTILNVRDRLKAIDSGEIERSNVRPGEKETLTYYSAHARAYTKGNRKTNLRDARSIAHHAIVAIDRALQEWDKYEEQ